MRIGNIIAIVFFIGLTGVLLSLGYELGIREGGGYLWTGSGLLGYTILMTIGIISDPEDDVGSSPSAGQAFIISLVVGPIMWLFILGGIIETISDKKKEQEDV